MQVKRCSLLKDIAENASHDVIHTIDFKERNASAPHQVLLSHCTREFKEHILMGCTNPLDKHVLQ